MIDEPTGTSAPRLPDTITCVECGGPCGMLTRYAEGFGPEPGDIVAYRCAHCLDRWDIEVPEDESGG